MKKSSKEPRLFSACPSLGRFTALFIWLLAVTQCLTVQAAIKITCVGDSLTRGNGASEENAKSYPGVLRTLLQANGDYQVGNFGFGGANLLPYAGTYTYTNTDQFQPGVNFGGDVIIFMLGTNDGATEGGSQHHLDEIPSAYDNLISFYTAGRNPAPRIIIATPPWVPIAGGPWGQNTINNTISNIVRNYAASRGYTLVDIQVLTTGHPEWSSDGMVHYNDAGYQAMATAFHAAVIGGSNPVPLMAVTGNGNGINDGSVTTGEGNHTAFGSLPVTNVHLDHVFRIQNNGAANLMLTGSPAVSISGANASDFTVIAQPGSTSVSGGSYTDFTVRFNPSASGQRLATVSIASNDTAHPLYTFAIRGDGLSVDVAVIDYGDTWRWNIPSSDPGSAWQAVAFNDSSWGSGPGLLGFEAASMPGPGMMTTVGATNASNVYLFRKSFNYSGSTLGALVVIDQIVDDGVSYYLNGNLIGSVRHAPGVWDNLATSSPPNNGDASEENNALIVPASGLVNGVNVLSAEVHQATVNSSDMVFGARVKIRTQILDGGAWRQTYFGSTSNSGNGADFADPDKDGLPNILEFFLMQDPGKSGSSWGVSAVQGGNLTLTYARRNAALSEVTAVCLWADNLSGPWSSTGVTEQILSDNGMDQTVRATVALSGANKKFFKVQVNKP